MLTAEYVRGIIHYDPETGKFRSLVHRGAVKAGDSLGSPKTGGYLTIKIDYKDRVAHRLAWLMHYGEWPAGDLDHINGVRDDNRIANLRLATPSQNCANSRLAKNNRCGFKGVTFSRSSRKPWRARITHQGQFHELGTFDTPQEANAAYAAAARRLFGEFARAG